MTRKITSNKVLQYYYGESLQTEKKLIENILTNNPKAQYSYCEIEQVDRILKKSLIKPNTKVIDNIILYSKTFASKY